MLSFINTMENLIKASIVVTVLIIGTSIVYGLIHLFNSLLYQIFVHPLRTTSIMAGLWAVYGIYYYLNKKYNA